MANRVTHRERPRRQTATERRARSQMLSGGPINGSMPFKQQRELSESRGCTTPYKRAFPTRQAAELGIARVLITLSFTERELPSRAYECACGLWHLTKGADRPLAVPAKVEPAKLVTSEPTVRETKPAVAASEMVQDVAIRVLSDQQIGRKPVVVPGLHRISTPRP